jgi:hypothetical protein
MAFRAFTSVGSLALALLALSPASAIGMPPAPAGAAQILPYSHSPPPAVPYEVCPPPTPTRATCSAVVDPKGVAGDGSRPARRGLAPAEDLRGEGAAPALCSNCGSGLESGFSPQDLQSAYRLPASTGGSGQTVAIVDAYDDPHAEEDLAVYRATYGLPPCTAANGCFTKVDQRGGAEFPPLSSEWGLEIALDLDMVSAACPNCRILLVEADNNLLSNLGAAVKEAASLGATEISNSYGSRDIEMGKAGVELYRGAYEQPGVAITAASGDAGYNNENPEHQSGGKCTNCSPSFPAALSTVVSVGGTNLYPEGTTGRGWQEQVWIFSGSGCALYVTKPSWQKDPGCAKRTTNDVAATAGGETDVSVYDTIGQYHGWVDVAGTSVGTPLVAGAIALEESGLRAEGIEGIYKNPANWFDVTEGSNWWGLDEAHTFEECAKALLCKAAAGYDGPTGIGTPNGGAATTPPSAVALPSRGVTSTAATLRGTVNPEGSSTTYRFEYGESPAYGTETPSGGGSVSGYTTPSTKTAEIAGLQPSIRYHYRVVGQSAGGTTYGGDRAFSTAPKVHEFNWGPPAGFEGALGAPEDTAVDPNGNVWVADTGNDRIVEFAASGAFLKACGRTGSGVPELNGKDIQFVEPAGIAIDPSSGWLYVSDRGNDRVQVIRPLLCEFQATFGTSGSGVGQLSEPSGIVFGRQPGFFISEGPGELLVADSGNDRVEVFAPRTTFAVKLGDFLAAFGSLGAGNGQFNDPTDVAAEPDEPGTYYVVDSGNGRVQKAKASWSSKTETLSLSYVSQFGSKGSGAGQFSAPTSVAADPTTGDVAVTDTGNHRIEEFLPAGSYVATFGSAGSGSLATETPKGVSADPTGDLYVADPSNDRIEVWRPSRAYDPKWHITPTPNPSGTKNSYLWGASCLTPVVCWAVGQYSSNGNVTYGSLAERWNGAEWTLQSVPTPSGSERAALKDVACSSLSSCEGVGYYRNGSGAYFSLAEHWDGASWSIRATPEPSGTQNGMLEGVSCTSSSACTAVGYAENGAGAVAGFAERWNGTQWTLQSTPAPAGAKATYPTAVSCTSSTRCTLVGSYVNGSSAEVPFAAAWDGKEWTLQTMPAPAGGKAVEPRGVSCTTSAACTAAGRYENSSGVGLPLAERWNGTEWSLQSAPTPSGSTGNSFDGVSCVSASLCTAVGASLNGSGKYTALAERWNGAEWQIQTVPNSESGESWLSGDVSCVSTVSCAAVGNNGKAFAEIYGDASRGTVLEADSYPASLTAGGSYELTTHAGYVSCAESSLHSQLLSAQPYLVLTGEYGACTATASKFPTLAYMNSCYYTLDVESGGPPYIGKLGIRCNEAGDAIEFKTYLGAELKTLLCTTKFRPQGGLDRVGLAGTGKGTERAIEVEIEAQHLEYEASGKSCAKETRTDGTIEGKSTLLGANGAGKRIGVFFGGEK